MVRAIRRRRISLDAMTLTPPPDPQDAPRRIVLIDLDWQEADLVPALLRKPEYHVRLVAGESEDNAGLRVAELCGVPHTLELADLTREIFDLALLGRHSGRRSQVERLLTALGTPVASPQTFHGETTNGHGGKNGHGRKHEDAAARTSLESVEDLDRALARALPDLTTIAPDDDAETLPGPDQREALYARLSEWAARSGARSVLLHAGAGNVVEPVSRFGPEDALLHALVHLALAEDAPHVVTRLDGDERGRAWGAWPFRTRGLRGALAAARFDPVEGRAQWEGHVQELRVAWEGHERRRTEPAPVPARSPAWLSTEIFAARIATLADGLGASGITAAVHRLRFDESETVIDRLCEDLPSRLREGDLLCRPRRRDVLVIHHGAPARFSSLRRRIAGLWEDAWRRAGHVTPAPPIFEERADLASVADRDAFLATARRWLGGR